MDSKPAMTTLTEYREAAEFFEEWRDAQENLGAFQMCELASTVLRSLAEGKVLCEGTPIGYLDECDRPVMGKLTQHERDICSCGGLPLLYAAATQGETE